MEDPLRHARHNLRGRLNALMLCVNAFEILETDEEVLEFLEMIEHAADKTVVALQEFEQAADHAGHAHPPSSPNH